MKVLGIESTCDETACAVVCSGTKILSNVISSQIDLHKAFGGVVPELACRRHIEVILPILDEALKKASVTLEEIDLIAVAHGPGLIGALLIGLNAAKALSLALNKPFIGVNHIKAHLYASIMSHKENILFPCLGVVLSGGHTTLVKMNSLSSYDLIGQTIDDAIGEAFDKAAKILDLPYPGGPEIEKLALNGDPDKYKLKSGVVKNQPFQFSFSGLKTSVLYKVKGQGGSIKGENTIPDSEKSSIAASFQKAAFSDVIKKCHLAAKKYNCRSMLFGGGVTNSQTLRTMFQKSEPSIPLFWPSTGLSLDNAAMIAGLGYHVFLEKGADDLSLSAETRISF